jgi:hypothetical protein
MADNVDITPGTGATIAGDLISGAIHQRVKISQGADGSATDVSSAAPLQVTLQNTDANTNKILVTPDLPTGAATAAKQLADGHSVALSATDNAVLDAIQVGTDKIPAQGQALAAASLPVVLTAAQISTLTPPAAITGFATSAKQLADGHNVAVNNASGASAVNIQDGGNTLTVDGTVAVTHAGLTALNGAINSSKMDVNIASGNPTTITATQSTASNLKTAATLDAETTKVIGTVNISASQTVGLAAGTAGIGKLTANSGVDIGDVDVTSISAGTNKIGDVDIAPRTTGGWSVGNFTSGDSFTALTATAQAIKASAGKFGGYYIYNPNAAATYVEIYNVAYGSVTVGTTNPKLVFCIPATSGANLEILAGIPFDTAMSIAATTTGDGNTAPTTALEAMIWYV